MLRHLRTTQRRPSNLLDAGAIAICARLRNGHVVLPPLTRWPLFWLLLALLSLSVAPSNDRRVATLRIGARSVLTARSLIQGQTVPGRVAIEASVASGKLMVHVVCRGTYAGGDFVLPRQHA